MPRIINAYEGNSALGDSLAKLGEAIYGDQAKNEVYRQTAFGKKRENDNIPLLADAAARGDRDAITRYGVLSNKTGQDTADFNRLGVSNHASSVDDPRLALATMGAGGAFGSTAPGQGRQLQNQITTTGMNNDTSLKVADMTSKRAADTQLAIDGRTLVPVDNGDGSSHYDTKTSAGAGHAAVPVTKEGVLGAMLRKYAAGNSPTDVGGTNPNAAANPFSGIPPQVQHVLGVQVPDQTMVHPGSGMTGISRDGGQNVILPNGATIPATGFQPVSQETALSEARGGIQRAQTAQPLQVGNPANSAAAADAARTSGIAPKLGTIMNNELGALPSGPGIIKGISGSPQIAPATQDARQTQDIRNNQARAVLLGAPGRQTVQAQEWVNALLPQGNALANPATEAAKIPKIVAALQGDHEQLRQIVQTTADPAERTKAIVQMHQIENTIRMYTDPAPAAAPTAAPAAAPAAAAPAQPAPTAGAPAAPTQTATNPKTGQKIGLVNGQWVPMQ